LGEAQKEPIESALKDEFVSLLTNINSHTARQTNDRFYPTAWKATHSASLGLRPQRSYRPRWMMGWNNRQKNISREG